MGNTPWEPCPRCGSNRVKVEPTGDIRGEEFRRFVVGAGIIAYALWAIIKFPPTGDGGGFVAALLIFLGCIFVFPVLNVMAALLGGLLSIGTKGYTAQCQDCSFMWEMEGEEAEQNRPAPSQTNQAR